MNNIDNAVRSLFRKGQHNLTKILCLGIGLAAGTVLVAKIYYEVTFDRFVKDYRQTYIISEKILMDGKIAEYPQTSGAIAQAVKHYCPQVKEASRETEVAENCLVDMENEKTGGGIKKFKAAAVACADSCFFDLANRPILAGNAREALSRPDYCMISKTLAQTMEGKNNWKDIVGKRLYPHRLGNGIGDVHTIVGGVYEDFPDNSSFRDFDIILSFGYISGWSKNNWVGNDRYVAIIRLNKNCSIDQLVPGVEKMRRENLPLEEIKKSGVDLNYSFTPFAKYHKLDWVDPAAKNKIWILSLLAFLLIFSATMNYLLVAIGNMVGRSNEMAVRKCYGAEAHNIYGIMFRETALHLAISVILAALIIFACKGTIEELLNSPLNSVLFGNGMIIIVTILAAVLIIGAYVPGKIYSVVPVTTAFRGYNETKRHWKQTLLAIQFVAAAFLISLLVITDRQYRMMINYNLGYDYNNLAYVDIKNLNMEDRSTLAAEIMKLAGVTGLTSSETMLTNGQNGNNIIAPDGQKEYFNIADLYSVSDGYISTMKFKLLQGKNFTEQTDSLKEVMVSKSFVDKMKLVAGWNDNAVGKNINITEHGRDFKICGVYNDIKIGSIGNPDTRPSIMFYDKNIESNLFIKYNLLGASELHALDKKIKELYPDSQIESEKYSSIVEMCYKNEKMFRETTLLGGIVTLMIALLGLIGYTNDEIGRRRKEIAIRKVNGASVGDILNLFSRDMMKIAIPSLIIGCAGAVLVAHKWLEQFSEKTPLSAWLFIMCGLLLLVIILFIVIIDCRKIAGSKSVAYLKSE